VTLSRVSGAAMAKSGMPAVSTTHFHRPDTTLPVCIRRSGGIDFTMMRSAPEHTTYRNAALLLLVLLSIVFWDSVFIAPVKLFVVLLHEAAHALAAILTGGSVERIEIDSRIGGLAITRGGWHWLVVSSGYVGSMLFGSLILLASVRGRGTRILAAALGIAVLLVTLLFVRNVFGLVFGVLFGAALLAAARYFSEFWLPLAVQYLGTVSCLYALIDVQEDLITLEHRLTDASIMASATGIPAIVWGVLWSVMSLLVLLFTLRLIWKRRPKQDTVVP
jgi:hypothetical protein